MAFWYPYLHSYAIPNDAHGWLIWFLLNLSEWIWPCDKFYFRRILFNKHLFFSFDFRQLVAVKWIDILDTFKLIVFFHHRIANSFVSFVSPLWLQWFVVNDWSRECKPQSNQVVLILQGSALTNNFTKWNLILKWSLSFVRRSKYFCGWLRVTKQRYY